MPWTALPSPAGGDLTRANQLDALAGVLPLERRDQLAALLTDQDVATLRHLVEQGMGANTLRALASDLAYLEAWSLAVSGAPCPGRRQGLVMRFLAHHLWDPAQRDKDPEHGMPAAVAAALQARDLLRVAGPHAPSTVKRRLAH